MRKICQLLILIFCCASSSGRPGRIEFRHLGKDSGLSQITINGLYQDEYGALWIGTKNGVRKYNGNRVVPVDLPEVARWISMSFAPTVCGDRKGHVYINADYNVIEYDLKREKAKVVFTQHDVRIAPATAFCHGEKSLWIGLKDSIFRYENGEVTLYRTLTDDEASVTTLKEVGGKLYVGTKSGGVFRLDEAGTESRVLPPCSDVLSIYEDSRKYLWIGTFSDGLFRISPQGDMVRYRRSAGGHPGLSSNYVRAVCEDDYGNIWVGTMQGLDLIDAKTGGIRHYGLSDRDMTGLSNLSVWVILKDDMGTMWGGTYYGGRDYCNPETAVFSYFDLGISSGNGYPIVSRIVEDKRGDLWIGTEGKGLLFFDRKANRHRRLPQWEGAPDNIKSLCYDRTADELWIGTHYGGLYRFRLSDRKLVSYTVDPADPTRRSNIVHALAQDEDRLYIGTLSGVYCMDTRSDVIRKVEGLKDYVFAVNDLLLDGGDDLWIAGNSLCRYRISDGRVKDFGPELVAASLSPKLATTALYRNGGGDMVVATAGYGFLIYREGRFHSYNSANCRIPDDYIGSIGEMRNGRLLIGHGSGFSCVDAQRRESYNYNADTGFPLHAMMPGCILRSEKGDIILGGTNGIALFPEEALLASPVPFRLYFDGFRVNNEPVSPGDPTGILSEALSDTRRIVLDYGHNNFSVEVGHDNFVNYGQPRYQYLLEGYDRTWIDFTPRSAIRYMNLPDGEYRLRVRALLARENPPMEEISLGIVVRPPLYAAWYAYLFYIVFSLGIVAWVVYFYRARLLFRTPHEMERREKRQQEENNDTKQRFFANMSHELRTPLTLITGQLELLLLSNQLTRNVHRNLVEIHHGAMRMNRLINELLDYLKHSRGMFRLRVVPGDIAGFLREACASFGSLAELRNVRFDFCAQSDIREVWFDPGQMRKVINNLLANAFKYTPARGTVTVEVREEGDCVLVRVRDTGIGIPPEMKDRIFERFYQGDNAVNRGLGQTGTGIGLSLSRNIVEAHHGTIRVESDPGAGSLFTVALPLGKSHFEGDPKVTFGADGSQEVQETSDAVYEDDGTFLEEIAAQYRQVLAQPHSLLIVEDDEVLRKMLIRIFEPLFHIYEAEDGEKGLRIALEHSPDLILSDVMMPGMSGSALCSNIKSNFETSHIPVVLLTALSSVEYGIQGLNCGADDYITKPFDIRLLVTRCLALLNGRRLLQKKFSRQEEGSPEYLTTSPMDREFIEKVIRVVEGNIENGNINVTFLCGELGISRTKLFLKMKGITGQTPHDFIQNIKLKKAARMLKEQPEVNISEIAYALGFSSLNYFGKYFRSYFGMSPTAYRKSAGKQTVSGTEEDE